MLRPISRGPHHQGARAWFKDVKTYRVRVNKISCGQLRSLFIAGAFLFPPAVATARWIDVLPELTAEDVELIQHKARVEMGDKPEGTILKWDNPKSGNSGNVTLLKRFSAEGRECRALRHVLNIVRAESFRYKVTICRQPDDTWKWRAPPR